MRKLQPRWLAVLIPLVVLAAAPTSTFAQSLNNYRGCLKANGKLKRLLRGGEPVKPCKLSETEIGLASADTTDNLEENLVAVIELANGVDERLEDVEMVTEEILEKVDGKVFLGVLSTAVGRDALPSEAPFNNTAVGANALTALTSTGIANTAVGTDALRRTNSPLGGNFNTAVGSEALAFNVEGSDNVAVGRRALFSSLGNRNIAIGALAGFDLGEGSDNIYIGNEGDSSDEGTIRIGVEDTQVETFIAGIDGTGVDGLPVVVSSNGQLGIQTSSRRYKKDIRPLGELSQDLMRLRPVVYRYKKPNADGQSPQRYGLIAEEVAQVYPELVAYSDDGRAKTVRYHELNSMLLNEVQKQHQRIQQQEAVIANLTGRLARLEAKVAN